MSLGSNPERLALISTGSERRNSAFETGSTGKGGLGSGMGQDFFESQLGGDLSWRCCDVCSPGPPLVRVKASVSVHGQAGMQAQARPHLQLFLQPWLGPALENAAGPSACTSSSQDKGVEGWRASLQSGT